MAMTVRYTTINGEVIAEKRSGVRKLYVPDPLGSTVALLDNTQTQTDTFTYWPYGEVRTRTGTTSTPFQFVGTLGYYSDAVGRTYVRARYLYTLKGRWLTQDPIGLRGGDANFYRIVSANPVSVADPSGMKVYRCSGGGVGPITHELISTYQCGAYGLHPTGNPLWSPGIVKRDDPYLQPHPKKPGIFIPGRGGKVPGSGARVHCHPIPSSDPGFEDRLCKCMALSTNPQFSICLYNCQNWIDDMLDCACTPKKWDDECGCVTPGEAGEPGFPGI